MEVVVVVVVFPTHLFSPFLYFFLTHPAPLCTRTLSAEARWWCPEPLQLLKINIQYSWAGECAARRRLS